MAGYLIISGSQEKAWEMVEHLAMPRTELEKNGYSLILNHEKQNYTVSDLEPLKMFLVEEMDHEKFCVIPDAERLTELLQNKLLKALEDSEVIFFLLSSSEQMMLPTVRSRLQCIRLHTEGTETERVDSLFSKLRKRKDLFELLHIATDKDKECMFYYMDIYGFFHAVEELFMELYVFLSWKDTATDVLNNISQYWSTPDEAMQVCQICEEYGKKSNLKAEDLFIFIAEITEVMN